MSAIERVQRGRAVTWRTILGLLLVPVTAAGVLLWGLWNPTERLESVTAAVVNLDEPVELDGQLVPLGRVLAAELIGSPKGAGGVSDEDPGNFTWLLTDEEDAAAGLDDGRYSTVITIPENFSEAATSTARAASGGGSSGSEGERAVIDIATSDRGRLLDSALSNIVTSTATAVLNEQLGSQFVGGVLVGMNEIGEGIGEAADGARQLASGGAQLADGVDALASGASELAGGASQLASGTAELSTGAAGISSGAAGLAGGANDLASGAGNLASGAAGLSDAAGSLASGAGDLASASRASAQGGAELADGVESYTGMVNTVVQAAIDSSSAAIEPLRELRGLIELLPEDAPLPEGQSKESLLATIDALLAEFDAAASGSPDSQLVQLRTAGEELAAGARASADGQAQLADGVEGFAAGLGEYAGGVAEFSGGASQLAGGASQLAGGASQLAGGASQLAGGASELAAGTPGLAAGASQLAGGVTELAGGARQAADGTSELASGLREAADGIPRYTEAQSERLAEIAVKPVEGDGAADELFNAAGVPLFAGIALWAGAFASFLVLAPLWRRTREAARGVGFVTLRSALPALAIGAAQGAVAGLVLPPLLGYEFGQGLAFFGLAVLAGAAFSLVNQGLSALFGGFGNFLSFALLVVAFAIGVISTAPGPLQAVGDASPVGALFGGFQAIAMGVDGAGSAAFALVLWGLGGLALTGFAVARARRSAVVRQLDK